MKKKVELAMTLCLLAAAFILARQGAILVQSEKAAEKEICIVVDAGHGGSDPGKVGVNDALEKDINLSLALKLKDLLEQKKINVVLTRDSDAGLYPAETLSAYHQSQSRIYYKYSSEQLYDPGYQRRAGILLRSVRRRGKTCQYFTGESCFPC